MAKWNNIVVGFDIAEETINFGTRGVAVCEDGVYESATVATIQSEDEVGLSPAPECHAVFTYEGVAITCDRSLILIDFGFTTVLFSAHFESPIDCIELSEDGMFIFCGLRNYKFLCLHIPTNGKVVFSKYLLEQESIGGEKVFSRIISRCTTEKFEAYAFIKNGMIERAFHSDVKQIVVALENETGSDVIESIEVSTIKTSTPNREIVALSQFYSYEGKYAVFAVDNSVSLCSLDGDMLDILMEKNTYNIKQISPALSSHIILCLCHDGILLVICLHTLQVIKKWEAERVKTFTILENMDCKSVTQILIITDSNQPELCLVEIPAFEIKLRLKVSEHSYLVSKQNITEDIIYIEAVGEEQPDTVRVKVVAESCPELRLNRLLQRRKFADAEKFAENLSLSLEEVYKAKVKWLMEKLQLINKPSELLEEYFNDLTQLLDKIQSVEFVAECCLKVIAPDLKKIQHLYNYAMERLRHCPEMNPEILKLTDEVNKSNIKLGTYLLVNEEGNSSENWIIFCTCNPIMICRNHLLRGEIQKAVIVCRRHEERIRDELPVEVAVELLEKIPIHSSVNSILKWLRVYIPVLLRNSPDLLQILIRWIFERTKALELENKSLWPENGLSFIVQILEILNELPNKDPCLEMPLPLDNNTCSAGSPIINLYTFARHIHQLLVLKKEYSISVDFDEYLSRINKENGHQEFLSLILDNVCENKISNLVAGFFKNYCTENMLEMDAILSAYVFEMLRRSSNWWYVENAWEHRALCFIAYIKSVNHKMEAIRSTVANVNVPWSAEVSALAEQAMEIDHPVAQDIYLFKNKIPVKLIMKKYGIPHEEFMTNVYECIKYIYGQGQDDMIEDAKQVVKSVTPDDELLPYLIYLLHTIESGDFEKGLQLVKSSLDKESLVKVTQRAISNLVSLLQNRHVHSEDKAFDAIHALHSTMFALDPQLSSDLEMEIHCLQSLRTLKNRYKLNIPFDMLFQSRQKREQFLLDYLSTLNVPEKSNLSRFVEDACQISLLLNLSRGLALVDLSQLYASRKNIALTAYCARLMLDSEASFFKLHSKKILDFISVLLNIITDGEKVEDEVWGTIHKLLTKIALFLRRTGDFVKMTNLFSLISLHYHPRQVDDSNIGKHFYTEQIEAAPVLPPSSYSKMLINGSPNTDEKQSVTVQKDLEKSLQLMPSNLTSIHRLQTILWTLAQSEVFVVTKELLEIMKDKVFKVLGRVIFARNLDLELALALLNLVPSENGMGWLKNYLSTTGHQIRGNLKNASALALVGKHFIALSHDCGHLKNQQKMFVEYYLKFQNFMKLQKFGIPPKVADKYCETHEGKKNLLLKLMTFAGVELNFLHDFCRDLNFSFQECLRFYLEHTLLTWKPQYEESVNPETGKCELLLLSKKEDLVLKCSQIEGLTVSKESLVDYLKKVILPRVNFYSYEVFLVIIDTILKVCPTHQEFFRPHQLLLSFLITYRRISPVSSEETDNWFHFFPDQSGVPHISKYRLPFAPLPSDPWKIIKPELSLKTYRLWLNAPSWLNVSLEKDVICSYTIMNLKGEITTNSEWNLHLQHQALMSDIVECISKIKNIETAVAASYCVVNYVMPPGADRVDAAQRCYLKAKEWVSQEQSENAKIGLTKAEKKYLTVSTYHILYKFQLARPELLILANQPANLITALYSDPSIITRTTDLNSSRPDINKAVIRITSLHDIKLVAVLKELLTEWLHTDSSLNSSFQSINLTNSSTYSDNIKRACYVLNGFKDLPILENTLLGIAFDQENCSVSAGVKLRALQCLRATKTNTELQQLTLMDLSSIRELMLSLEFVSDLEKFSLDYTVLEFDSCKKEDIIETLLKLSCPGAIVLSVKIAITYKIWLPSIWNSLLSSMTSLKMVKVLEYSLPELSHIACQVDRLIFKSAWEQLLLTSLSSVKNEGTEALKEIERTFNLIGACPIITNLDLNRIITIYQDLNYPELAEFLSTLA